MRLLITTDTVGGVWTYSSDLVSGLLARSVCVMLVTVGREPEEARSSWLARTRGMWPESFDMRHIDVPLEWMPNGSGCYEQSEQHMLAICDAFRPHVVHCNQFCYGALPVRREGRLIPKVVAAHSDVLSWWRARYGRPMPPSAWRSAYMDQVEAGLNGADVIIAPTAASLGDLQASFSFSTPSRVIVNGRTTASAALSEIEAFAHKRLRAMSCGRLWDEGKNIALLNGLSACPVPVVVAGESAAVSDISPANDTPSPPPAREPAVRALGPLDSAALDQLMREAAIYVVTSRYEPFGLAAVEAALAGCAIVASDLPSQREVWGDAAVFYPSDDAPALDRELTDLAGDPGRLRAIAQRCRERALARFPAERMVSAYADLYRELIVAAGTAHDLAPRERGVRVA